VAVGLSISTIRRLIQSGRLRARFERGDKGQHRYFIARADLATLAAVGKGTDFLGGGEDDRREPSQSRSSTLLPPDRPRSTQEHPTAPAANGDHEPLVAPSQPPREAMELHGLHEAHAAPSPSPADPMPTRSPEAPGGGDQEHPAAPPQNGDTPRVPLGTRRQEAPRHDPHGAHGAPTVGVGEPGSLKDQAAYLELAVLRERLSGAQEAVRLHAERVRGQAKDIGFLHAQLDQSREAETQLRVLLARVTAALPPPEEKPALVARTLPPPPKKVRWWWPWGRG
jgi:hypothetical protein